MPKRIPSIIGAIVIIISVFLPIISLNITDYHDYDIIFHYWLSGLMYVSSKNGNGRKSGYRFDPNLIGFACMVAVIALAIMTIVKSARKKDPIFIVIFGIIATGFLVGTTFFMMALLEFALKSVGLGTISSSLIPSYGFYCGIIGGILIVIGGLILKEQPSQIKEAKPKTVAQQKPSDTGIKFCEDCGKIIRNGDRFCIECGAPIKQ